MAKNVFLLLNRRSAFYKCFRFSLCCGDLSRDGSMKLLNSSGIDPAEKFIFSLSYQHEVFFLNVKVDYRIRWCFFRFLPRCLRNIY